MTGPCWLHWSDHTSLSCCLRAHPRLVPGPELCWIWSCDRLSPLWARCPSKYTKCLGRASHTRTAVDLPTLYGHLPHPFSRFRLHLAHPALSKKNVSEMVAHCFGCHQRCRRAARDHLNLQTMLTHTEAMGSQYQGRTLYQPRCAKKRGHLESM